MSFSIHKIYTYVYKIHSNLKKKLRIEYFQCQFLKKLKIMKFE